MSLNLEQQFINLSVQEGLYSSNNRFRFYLNYVFRNVSLIHSNVLDVGSGRGLLSFYAALRGADKVVSLEPEATGSGEGVIGFFNRFRLALPAGLPIDYLPLTLQSYIEVAHRFAFDIVLLHNSINHLDEDACIHLKQDADSYDRYFKIFSNVYRMMAPGGKLLILDCSCKNLFHDFGLRNFMAPSIEWHKHQAPETWIGLLEKTGFKNPNISWTTPNRFGKAGQWLMGNRSVAYLTRSHFKINMEK